MADKREIVVSRLTQLQKDCEPLLRMIKDDPALIKQLKAEKLFTPQHLQEKYEVSICGAFRELISNRSPRTTLMRYTNLPSFNLSAVTIQQQQSTYTTTALLALPKTRTLVLCGESLQQRFSCKTGRLLLRT